MENKYRVDRTVFRAITAKEADDYVTYWRDESFKERLEAGFYLIYKAYGVNASTKLDRTVFSMKKRETQL